MAEEFLPGTRRLYDADGNVPEIDAPLKRHGDIILAPQPTDHADDPLGWSIPRKIWHASLLLLITAVTGATTNDAGSAQFQEVADYGISDESFNTGAGVLFVGVGYWTFLISPAASLYGRRISYLVCLVLGITGAIWFACGHKKSDAIWNQLLVGASESCSEANVQLSLMDVFFQHQRGAVLGAYMLAISAGTYLGPLVAGYIASNMGWQWIGWFGVVFNGLLLIVFYFGLEETYFDRARFLVVDGPIEIKSKETMSRDPKDSSEKTEQVTEEIQDRTDSDHINVENHASSDPERPKSYRQQIALISLSPNVRGTGFKQYFQRLFHTLRIFTFPAVWFAGLQWGAQDAWLTFYLTVEDNNWSGPPWNESAAALGTMNVPCLIGAIIGCAYGGWFSDPFVRWMAKRNGGIVEAEMRLWLMLPATIIFPLGMFLFGAGSAHGWPWPVPYIALGFIGFGWGNAGDLGMAYLEDCYPNMILEGMVGVAVINNTIGMIFTFGSSPWLDVSGVLDTLMACGALAFFFLATTLPMIIYGKVCRRWTANRYQRFVLLRDGFY